MMNKIYEWMATSYATFREGAPRVNHSREDARAKRKRPIDGLEDCNDAGHEDGRTAKKSRRGDLMDTVKGAAERIKDHGSTVATWVKNNVSPTLRSILPGPPPAVPQPQASTSAATWTGRHVATPNSGRLDAVFAAPSTTPSEWKLKSESYRIEKFVMGSKVCRRQVCMNLAQREVAKTNGHSTTVRRCSTPTTTAVHPPPRLGRPLSLHPHGTSRSYTSMYEKTFPIRMVQSPSHGPCGRLPGPRRRSAVLEQSVCEEEEKEAYRQLLKIVSGGHSSCLNVRSHRDFTSLLSTSKRLLQASTPAGAEGVSDVPSMSPRGLSSRCSSSLPSPVEPSVRPGTLPWSPGLSSTGAASIQSVPSPGAVLDTSSRDSLSSAHDGDSVIIVKEERSKKPNPPSVPCFKAELWIKELTSMYDSRARERRRQIEEQEALAAMLLRQRLSGDGQLIPKVEVHIRVPLEKEVPLTPLIKEPKKLVEKPEFPELVEEMEDEVSRVLKGGSPHEVLSEGFGLSLTRKDLQTLGSLNWLNDEVINFYMNLLVQRSKSPGMPTVNTFNTFFFPKLRTSGYSAVRRWTKKMDIFAADILLVPVHLGVHWCLSVVDFRKKVIMYYDSMGGNNDEACQTLLQYLKLESKDKKGKEIDTSGWTLHSRRRNEIPQQMNGSDCGMFTCKYAEYITKDKAITFTQRHMPYFRRRMIWELLNRKLL
ncbi:sentrin-specific protease 1 isoform X1 [Gadus macrocephalus]|uniref:sentrin-specific protease 1 isoform X1 n=1 Tax=Gadus macrocephalus TaxID=80720 RepID=UPI0028CB8482|nr:sentrin-specific protease 1 isoform X1 [Gadus macrocephalus]